MAVQFIRPTAILRQSALRPLSYASQRYTNRSFATLDPTSTESRSLSASRTLPYPTTDVFDVIADIKSYSDFVPYCEDAQVHEWSKEDEQYKRKWPQQASLTIGYGGTGINESFTSRVTCVPPVPGKDRISTGMVEAISGDAVSGIKKDQASHHTHGGAAHNEPRSGPLTMLKTLWTVRGYPYKPGPENGQRAQDADLEPGTKAEEMTDVTLKLDYQFQNPVYDMMSRAAASKIAEKMVEAFQERIKVVLDHKKAKREPSLDASPDTHPGHTGGKAASYAERG